MFLEIGSFPPFSDQEKKALIWLFSVIFPRAFFCESGFYAFNGFRKRRRHALR